MFINSCKLFFKNIKLIVPSIALFIISFILFLLILLSAGIGFSNQSPEYILSHIGGLLGILILLVIVILILSVISHSWTLQMTTLAVKNLPYTLIDSLKGSLKYFWRILGYFAIQFAIMFVLMIVFSITLGVVALNTFNGNDFSAGISSISIGIIIFMIVLLLATIFLSFSMLPISYVIIYDNLGIGEGFSKGFKFGVKKFFRLFGISILFGVIIGVISIPFENAGGVFIVVNILLQLIGLAFSIILGIYVLNLYIKEKTTLNNIDPHVEIEINTESEDN